MDAPKIYSYDEKTGEIRGNRFAQLDPLTSQIEGRSVYFPPGSTSCETIDEPLAAKDGYAVCFINGAWLYMEDFRGTEVYSKTNALPCIIEDLGQIPDEYTIKAPDCACPIWDGEKWKVNLEQKLSMIRIERDRRLDETDLKYCNAERWSQMSADDKAAWSEYKQALRDLPETIDPNNPVWPDRPVI
ncbi:MAG TPA: hypothetical protein DCG53_13630 [Syntrophus sp. (in: bacteria)]|jgi:hypothetical protein|nr:hypothetical protein [Syntrophus sp. (in: bacteria)]